jgi:hypothetical protein
MLHLQVIEPHVESFLLKELKPNCTVGLVGGSDFKKIAYQMGGSDEGKKGFFALEYLVMTIKNLCCVKLFEILSRYLMHMYVRMSCHNTAIVAHVQSRGSPYGICCIQYITEAGLSSTTQVSQYQPSSHFAYLLVPLRCTISTSSKHLSC